MDTLSRRNLSYINTNKSESTDLLTSSGQGKQKADSSTTSKTMKCFRTNLMGRSKKRYDYEDHFCFSSLLHLTLA